MIPICPMSTLRAICAGEAFYIERDADLTYRIRHADGRELSGYRGNPYKFGSFERAEIWLHDTRSKTAKSGDTSQGFIDRLWKIQNQTLAPYLYQEIIDILDRNNGVWVCTLPDDQDQGGGAVFLDGGFCNDIYLESQVINGGGANG